MNNKISRDEDGIKILLLEDDHRLLRSLKMRLEQLGYQCCDCDNASEAISHFTMERVDLVITDVTMHGIDGLAVITLIRSQSDIPIIVISGHANKLRLQLAPHRKMTILQKPFELETLVECIHTSFSGGTKRNLA